MKKVKAVSIKVDIRVEGEKTLDTAIVALETLLIEIKNAKASGEKVAAVNYISGEEIVGEAEAVLETFDQDGEDDSEMEYYVKALEEATVVVL